MSAISPPISICQEELEHLNQASDEINRLELQLDVSNMCDTTTVSEVPVTLFECVFVTHITCFYYSNKY